MFNVIQKMKTGDERGFTLVELLIVIAIIAILAAIAIPQFAAYRQRGIRASMQSDARNISTMEEATFGDTQSYFAIASAGPGGTFPLGNQTGTLSTGNTLVVNINTPIDYTVVVTNANGGTGSTNYSQTNSGQMGFY